MLYVEFIANLYVRSIKRWYRPTQGITSNRDTKFIPILPHTISIYADNAMTHVVGIIS